MIQFRILGTLDLRDDDGSPLDSPVSGSKRLALLVYLCLARPQGLHRRDALLPLLYPDSDQRHARGALRNLLHHVRVSLGQGVIASRGNEEIGLARDAVWCDAIAFEEALAEGRLVEALELYRADLLEGFHVPDVAPEFEHWLDAERARLRRRAIEATRALVERAGSPAEAIHWARRAHALDPFDEPSARRLIMSLDQTGDRAGALRAYENFAARIEREFGAEPSAETRAALECVRERYVPLEIALAPRTAAAQQRAGSSSGVEIRGAGVPDDLPVRSIAVLPFDNLSGAAHTEPFAAGLHGDLLTELSRISALSVIARTSVLRYRDTERTIPEIARELGVGTIVQGGVQTAGGRLRLNVQVIHGESGAHRWAERYDRELSMDNLFELQGELAEKIAAAVRAKLTPAERERGGHEPTGDLEAYRLHAQGRALLDQRTEGGMRRSIDYFERALEMDPDYALAWVGLADALALLHDYGHAPPDEVLPRAEDAVHRALALGPHLAEAHASLGLLHSTQREGAAALRALRRAVQLRPGYAEAHNWLSWNLQVLGYAEEALESAERAVELDPQSSECVSNLCMSLLTNGRPEASLRVAQRVRELSPDWTSGAWLEGMALYQLGRHGEAISILQGLTVEWAGSGAQVTLALVCAASGDRAGARELLRGFDEADDLFAVGQIRLALGERERAFAAFECVDDWGYWEALCMHSFFPDVMAPLRADPLYHRMRCDMDRSWGRDVGEAMSDT